MTSYDYHNGDINQIIGKTMRSVEQTGKESITFVDESGARWSMHYEPDCCASCEIEDVVGDLQDLVGSPIVMAEVATNSTDEPSKSDEHPESYTWTFYKFATAKGYVTVRWYGSSNGYYSETASFRRIADES